MPLPMCCWRCCSSTGASSRISARRRSRMFTRQDLFISRTHTVLTRRTLSLGCLWANTLPLFRTWTRLWRLRPRPPPRTVSRVFNRKGSISWAGFTTSSKSTTTHAWLTAKLWPSTPTTCWLNLVLDRHYSSNPTLHRLLQHSKGFSAKSPSVSKPSP